MPYCHRHPHPLQFQGLLPNSSAGAECDTGLFCLPYHSVVKAVILGKKRGEDQVQSSDGMAMFMSHEGEG